MTSHLQTDKESADRVIGAEAIMRELKQFRKLQHLSNDQVAFRMAMPLREVHALRKMFGQNKIPLTEVGLTYDTRLLLGSRRIATVGDLLRKTDEQLLAIPQLGHKKLEAIREAVRNHLWNI